MRSKPQKAQTLILAVLASTVLAAGCRQDMHDTPRYEAYESSATFADNRASRVAPVGTVARGWLRDDEALYTGKIGGQPVDEFPFAIGRADLLRGQERFNIYCTPCHGKLGDGNGMVVSRGLRQAASYHQDRLRQEKLGYFYDVDHQRLRRDAGLRGADSGSRSLADRRLRAHAAIEPARVGRTTCPRIAAARSTPPARVPPLRPARA